MPFLQAFVSACMLEAHELRSWWQEGTCVLCHFRYPSCSHLCCAWRSYYCVLSFLCSHTIHSAVIDDSQAFYLTTPLTSLLSHCLRECLLLHSSLSIELTHRQAMRMVLVGRGTVHLTPLTTRQLPLKPPPEVDAICGPRA